VAGAAALAALAALAAGCYGPTPPTGSPCGATPCPTPLVCAPATSTCERAPADGRPLDATPGDGAPPAIDAPTDAAGLPGDQDGDGVPDVHDNCPMIANADQHDHDHDGHGDACDRCPHLPDALDPDGDGDGVGDACDPHPTTAGDVRALWDGFYGPSLDPNVWNTATAAGAWSTPNGVLLEQDPTIKNGSLLTTASFSNPTITTSATLNALANNVMSRGLGISAGDLGASQYYDCTLTAANAATVVISTLAGGAAHNSSAAWTTTFVAGDTFIVSEQVRTGGLVGASCTVVAPGAPVVTATTSAGPSTGPIGFVTRSVSASYDYVFVVSSP
jgi:hypothetical protein